MDESRETAGAAGPPRIRRATADDAEALAGLSTALGYPSTPEQMNARLGPILGDPEQVVFVAEGRDAGVVGFIEVAVKRTVESEAVAEIVGLVVDERQRGGGIGGALVAEGERWVVERGITAVVVRSRVHRIRAHAFYERLDYRHLKDQKVFRKSLC